MKTIDVENTLTLDFLQGVGFDAGLMTIVIAVGLIWFIASAYGK